MPPGQPKELSELCDKHPNPPSLRSSEIVDLTHDEDSGASMGRHDRERDDPQPEVSHKHARLAANGELVDVKRKTVTIPAKQYKTLTKDIARLQKACTSKHQESLEYDRRITDELRDHDKTKDQLAELQERHGQMEAYLRGKIGNLNSEVEGLQNEIAAKDVSLQGKDQLIQAQLQEQKTAIAAAERYKNEYEKLQASSMEKDQMLGGERTENENLRARVAALLKDHDSMTKELMAKNAHLRDCQNALVKREEEFQTQGTELRTAQEKLDRSQEEVQSLRVVNDRNGAHNQRLRSEHAESKKEADLVLKNLRTELNDCHKQVAVLKQGKLHLQREMEENRADFEIRRGEWNQKKLELVKKLRQGGGQQQSINYYKEPDQQVQKTFYDLQFKIAQFINRYLKSVSNAADRELEPVWHKLMADPAKFLKSRLLYNAAFEAYIWESILSQMASPASHVWPGELGNEFFRVLRMTSDEIKGLERHAELRRDYQDWRSISCNIFERLTKRHYNPELFISAAEVMVKSLSTLCGDFKVERAVADAMEIFDDARSLFIMLKKLRAEIKLIRHVPDINGDLIIHGFKSDATFMEIVEISSGSNSSRQKQVVDLVVSPCMIKRGNNDGTDFQAIIFITKMKVICGVNKPIPKAKAPDREQPQTPDSPSGGSTQGAQQLSSATGATRKEGSAKRIKTEEFASVIKQENQDDSAYIRSMVNQPSSRTLSSGSETVDHSNPSIQPETALGVPTDVIMGDTPLKQDDENGAVDAVNSGLVTSEGKSTGKKGTKRKKKATDENDGDYVPGGTSDGN